MTPPMLYQVTVSSCPSRSPILMHVFRMLVHLFSSYIMQRLTIQYSTLTANIRTRRGSKVAINLPIFFDEKTPQPFIDPTVPWDRNVYPEDFGMWSNTVWRDGLR